MVYDDSVRSIHRWERPVFSHELGEILGSWSREGDKAGLVRDGVHSFYTGGLPIDCLLRSALGKPLFVFLNPLVNRGPELKLPVFVGQGVCPDRHQASCLCISDPTLILAKDLRVAWFQGFPQFDLPIHILSIISMYRQALEAPLVVLCGGSSAGFASISFLSRIPGCIALTWNPQIDISKFYPEDVRRYAQLFDRDATEAAAPDILRRHVQTDATATLALADRQALFTLQNASDDHHVRHHWTRLLDFLGETGSPNPGWLTPGVFAGMGSWGSGHQPLPRDTLRQLLAFVATTSATSLSDWGGLTCAISEELRRTIAPANEDMPRAGASKTVS